VQLGVSHTTVRREISKARPDAPKKQSGRPPKLTMVDKRKLVRNITSGKADTAMQLVNELNMDVGVNTIRRALKEAGMWAVSKKKKPKLQPKHLHERLAFALRHQSCTVNDWKRVIWSDETKINRLESDGREWVWKKRGSNHLTSQHVKGTVKFGGGNLMMWGCMTTKGVGYACRIDQRMDAELYMDILEDYFLPMLNFYKMNKEKIIF